MKKKKKRAQILTKTIKKKEGPIFKSEYFPHHEIWILPLFILTGLRKEHSTQVDMLEIAQMLTPNDDSDLLNEISKELERYAESVSEKESEYFLAVLSNGLNGFGDFEEPEVLEFFYHDHEDLLAKHPLDECNITKYLFHGRDSLDWYSDTLEAFKKQLGGYDIDLFVKLFAITSPRMHFNGNLQAAIRAYELFKRNKPFEGAGFLPAVVKMLNDFRKGEFSFDKKCENGRRKITNFARAILGDKDAVVIDSWLLRSSGLIREYRWRGNIVPHSPKKSEYDLMENYVRILAKVSGYEPRQIVAMLWSGTRTVHFHHKETRTVDVLAGVLA